MAEPVTMAALNVAKKIAVSLLSEPEKLIKWALIVLLLPIFIIGLLFAIPGTLAVSVPSILFGGGTDNAQLEAEQMKYVAIYQQAPAVINQSNLNWIEQKKREYSSSDDLVIKSNYTLGWQQLMSIDAVLLNQDFSKAKENDIIKLGEKFIDRFVSTETYPVQETYTETVTRQVQEEYQVEEEYQETVIEYIEETRTIWKPWVENLPFLGGRYVEETITTPVEKTVTKTRVVTKTRTVSKTEPVTKVRTVNKRRTILNIVTKPFNTVLDNIGMTSNQKEVAINIYNTISRVDFEGQSNIYDSADLKEYPPGNATLPYYNQGDSRWGLHSYGSSTIKSGGCGPTSLSMVVSGLTGRKDINPLVVADWSVANGYRAEGAGSYWSLMTAGGAYYGLKVESVSRMNPDKIIQALSKGNPVIASMGRGHFTQSGHFIVLTGVNSDGKILVHDPASMSRTNQVWDISIIMNESSTNAGISGSPFWIFSK